MLIRAKAPLRINFADGVTDIPPYSQIEGGCVICATIDKYAWVPYSPPKIIKLI